MIATLPPLVRGTLFFAAGLLAGFRAPPGIATLVLLIALPVLLLVLAVARPGGSGSRVLLGTWLAGGIGWGAVASEEARRDCRSLLPDGAQVAFLGRLEALPPADGAIHVRLDAVRVHRRELPCRGTVRARPPRGRGGPELEAGGAVAGRGQWWALPPEGPWPRRPERAGVLILEALADSAADEGPPADATVRTHSSKRAPLLRLRGAAQARIRRLFAERAAVAEALLLARKEGLDDELRERFAQAGLSHLLAISGLHVGVIAGVLLLAGRLARLPHAAAAGVSAAVTLLYVGFLGFPHAAVRASLQAVLFLLARALQRPAHPWALLSAAALAILLADPLALLDVGFQLSFAGVGGLLWLRRPLLDHLPATLGASLREGLAASLAATAATAPLVAYHFGQAAPIGVLANLIAIPLAALAVPAAAVALLVGVASEPMGGFLAGGAEVPLALLDAVARLAATIPGGHGPVARDTVVLGCGVALLAAHSVRQLRTVPSVRAPVRWLAPAALCLALVVSWPVFVRGMTGDRLEIHAIDVGQGDALALRTPAGRWILVDAGPRSESFDAGRSRIVPYLLRNGAHRVELMVLTHADADHIGGAAAVLDLLPVARVLDPALVAGKDMYLEALLEANQSGVRWLAARAGDAIEVDGVRLLILAPPDSLVATGAGTNEASVVFRAEYGAFAALFLGDAYVEVEQWLVSTTPEALRADLLKVGHHGSLTSTSTELLSAADPRLAVISVGRRNRYGHPHPTVLRRLESRGVRVLRTDLHGAITIRATRSGAVTVETTR